MCIKPVVTVFLPVKNVKKLYKN